MPRPLHVRECAECAALPTGPTGARCLECPAFALVRARCQRCYSRHLRRFDGIGPAGPRERKCDGSCSPRCDACYKAASRAARAARTALGNRLCDAELCNVRAIRVTGTEGGRRGWASCAEHSATRPVVSVDMVYSWPASVTRRGGGGAE